MRKISIIFLFVVLSIITFLNFSKSQNQIESLNTPVNMILFIGDGMGVSQVSAAKTVKGSLNMERFKTMGMVTTYSINNYVTDSAAGGTALATGHKTYNGAISVDHKERKPIKTVMEYAIEENKSTGLVSTCAVTHATPASFSSHVPSRNMQNKIAEQLARLDLTVLFGGGWQYFVSNSVKGSARRDSINYLDTLATHMQIALTAEEYAKINEDKPAAALLFPDHPPIAAERKISLADMTTKALRMLSKNSNGFVLMVEGSQIDWGGHDNDTDKIINETIDFDDAVGVGLDFAEKNPNTLVLVTADHETGGYSVLGGSVADSTVTKTAFTTGGHSGVMVPLFAYGPGSDNFAGIQDNTNIGKTMIQFVQPLSASF